MLMLDEKKKEEIKSPRRMKIQQRHYESEVGYPHPVIRISGKYLESLGFYVGDEIDVSFDVGQITITKVSSTSQSNEGVI